MTPPLAPPPTTAQVIPPALARKLIQLRHPNQRMTIGACVAVGELLRIFITEARHRASIEAECEDEGGATRVGDGDSKQVTIRPDHIAKIAAELLMDFS